MAPITKKTKQSAQEVEDVVLEAAQDIILEETPFAKVMQLSNGTVRRDRLTATDDERKAARLEAKRLRDLRGLALGSNLDGSVDDSDLE